MVRIEVNGGFLNLKPGATIRFKFRNPLMYEDVIPRDYTFPFNIPLNDSHNSVLLGYPEGLQNRNPNTKQLNCKVYIADAAPRTGILTFKCVTANEAEANIVIGKDTNALGDTNLRDIDMGSYVLEDTVFMQMDLEIGAGINAPTYIANGDLFHLSINGQLFSLPYQTTAPPSTAMYGSFVTAINSGQSAVTATQIHPGTLSAFIRIVSNTPGLEGAFTLDNLQEMLDIYNNGPTNAGYYWQVQEEELWIESHISAVDAKFRSLPESDPFCPFTFPILKNSKFTDDEKYVGFQNSRIDRNLINKDTVLGFITPFPKLEYVLPKIFEFLGYSLFGDFTADSNIKQLIIETNKAADYWQLIYGLTAGSGAGTIIYSYNKEVNIHPSILYVAKHLPDTTITEFLKAIKTAFNLLIDYDEVSKTVNVSFAKQDAAINKTKAIDYTSKALAEYQICNPSNNSEINNIKGFKWAEDTSDEKQKELLPFQKELILDPFATKTIEPNISSIAEVATYAIWDFPLPSALFPLPVNVVCGWIEEQGAIRDANPTNSIRFLIYRGRTTLFDMAMATSTNALTRPGLNAPTLSLSWHGDDGIYKKYWEGFAFILNEGMTLKRLIQFDEADIIKLKKIPFHRVHLNFLIWKDIEIELGGETIIPSEVLYKII